MVTKSVAKTACRAVVELNMGRNRNHFSAKMGRKTVDELGAVAKNVTKYGTQTGIMTGYGKRSDKRLNVQISADFMLKWHVERLKMQNREIVWLP
ncbi:MAG: hypothetical protein PHD76_05705 [Methylacidiphilales bacterium]|nr:hypothetical protein [Candidatus Methylacidiphilales bacterium]